MDDGMVAIIVILVVMVVVLGILGRISTPRGGYTPPNRFNGRSLTPDEED